MGSLHAKLLQCDNDIDAVNIVNSTQKMYDRNLKYALCTAIKKGFREASNIIISKINTFNDNDIEYYNLHTYLDNYNFVGEILYNLITKNSKLTKSSYIIGRLEFILEYAYHMDNHHLIILIIKESNIPELIKRIYYFQYYDNNFKDNCINLEYIIQMLITINITKKVLFEIVKELYKYGRENHYLIRQLIIKHNNYDVSYIDDVGNTILITACRYIDDDTVIILLNMSNNISVPYVINNEGETALIIACKNSMSNIALLLINTSESNPLHYDHRGGAAYNYAKKNNLKIIQNKLMDIMKSSSTDKLEEQFKIIKQRIDKLENKYKNITDHKSIN